MKLVKNSSTQMEVLQDFLKAFYPMLKSSGQAEWEESKCFPAANLLEKNDCYLLDLDLPGINPDSIIIEVYRQILTIKGERILSDQWHTDECRLLEITGKKFIRDFVLGEINPDEIDATFKFGVLHLVVKKHQESSARKIEIKNLETLTKN